MFTYFCPDMKRLIYLPDKLKVHETKKPIISCFIKKDFLSSQVVFPFLVINQRKSNQNRFIIVEGRY